MNFEQIANVILERAGAAGAEVEVYISSGVQTEVAVSKGEVDALNYAGRKGAGIRVIHDGRMGYAYTSDFSTASLERTTDRALALAEVADGDPYRSLPDPQPIPDEDLKIYDSGVGDTPMDDKVALALAVEKAALDADPRVALALRARYIDGTGDVFLANSKGFRGSYRSSFSAAFTQAMAIDGEERAMGFGLGVGLSPSALDPQQIGNDAGTRAAKLLGGRPIPTQEATVVFAPFAAAPLIGAFSQALNAEAMQKNRSFLTGRMGQEIASDMVSLVDNGRLPGGLASRPFDDEGNPTQATKLVDEGILQAVLYDQYTANREGTNSTGNASRGSHRGAPSLSPSNFYLQPGPMSPDELIAAVDQGLYVVNVMNTNSINPISGEFSVSAQGFWIEDGQVGSPVNNVTISIPLADLLQNVSAVANDLMFLPFMGALGTPTFRVDGVMIGGT